MRITLIFILLVFLSACSSEHNTSSFVSGTIVKAPTPENPQEITFVTYASANTYYINADNQYAGIEYDLVDLFTKKYAPEYKVSFKVVNTIADVIPALTAGKADIAAANLQITPERKKQVLFAKPYDETQQHIVYNRVMNKQPKNLAKLLNKAFIVPAKSSSAEQLTALKTKMPALSWEEDEVNNTELLLSKVAHGKLAYTMANTQMINLMQNYYPNLQETLAIGEPNDIAWALQKHADKRLVKKVNDFFTAIKKSGELRNLLDRYYGHSDRLDETDITHFLNLVETRLPKYKRLFQQAEAATGLNWRLLAALSFRESHWDPTSTSPTNVRGIMMLTEDTAQSLGVSDRLDPVESIPAGAKYILQLKQKFSKKISEPDRTYLALASYNIGYAHVLDARKLARRLKLNPDSWADIKKTLILLNDPKYFNTVKYGYASGGAPIVFVETIRSYQRILEKYQPSKTQIQSGYFVAAR